MRVTTSTPMTVSYLLVEPPYLLHLVFPLSPIQPSPHLVSAESDSSLLPCLAVNTPDVPPILPPQDILAILDRLHKKTKRKENTSEIATEKDTSTSSGR